MPAVPPPVQQPRCYGQLEVRTDYPAGYQDVEQAILAPLENVVRAVEGVGSVHSFAGESSARLVIEPAQLSSAAKIQLFDQVLRTLGLPGVKGQKIVNPRVQRKLEELNLRNLEQRVRTALEGKELAAEAEAPAVLVKPGRDRFVIVAAGQLQGLELVELSRWAHDLGDVLQRSPEVYDVRIVGDVARELRVFVDPTKLETHSISLDIVRRSLFSAIGTGPARSALDKIDLGSRLLSPSGKKVSDVARLKISASDGPRVFVGDHPGVLLLVRARQQASGKEMLERVSALAKKKRTRSAQQLLISGMITLSRCSAARPTVSGPIAALRVVGEQAKRAVVGAKLDAILDGSNQIVTIEGGSVFESQSQSGLEIVVLAPDAARQEAVIKALVQKLAITPALSTTILAPMLARVDVELSHNDWDALGQAANTLHSLAEKQPSVLLVKAAARKKNKIDIQMRRGAMLSAGLSAEDVVRFVRVIFSGEVVGELLDGDGQRKDHRAVLRLFLGEKPPDGENFDIARIGGLPITGRGGAKVTLGQVAAFTTRQIAGDLYRRDGRRAIVVSIWLETTAARVAFTRHLAKTIAPQLKRYSPELALKIAAVKTGARYGTIE